jgi:hypothetical protein
VCDLSIEDRVERSAIGADLGPAGAGDAMRELSDGGGLQVCLWSFEELADFVCPCCESFAEQRPDGDAEHQ